MYLSAEEVQIVGMPAHDHSINTIDELLSLPEDGMRHELLEGEHVVTPAPRPLHQVVLVELLLVVRDALAGRGDLQVFLSPADVVLGPRSLVQPDLFVVARKPGTVIEHWSDVGIPVLAVEVLSPSTAARDRGQKRRIYQQSGVAEYWILDLDARLVERWMPSDERPEIVAGPFEWRLPDGAWVTIEPAKFFAALPPAS